MRRRFRPKLHMSRQVHSRGSTYGLILAVGVSLLAVSACASTPSGTPPAVSPRTERPAPLAESVKGSPSDVPNTILAALVDSSETPTATRSSSGRTVAGVSLLGGAVAAGVTATVFGVLNRSNASRGDELRAQLGRSGCPNADEQASASCTELRTTVKNQNNFATGFNVSALSAAALLGASVLTIVLWPGHSDTRTTRLAPTVDPIARTAGLAGSF
jgi:hypothetical protein